MNDIYDIAGAVNPNEDIYSKSARQGTAKYKQDEDSALDIVASQYAELLWELYWHKQREAKRKTVDLEEHDKIS